MAFQPFSPTTSTPAVIGVFLGISLNASLQPHLPAEVSFAKTCIGHPLGVSHTHMSGSSGPWTAMGMCWSKFNSDNGLHMLQIDGADPSIRVSPSLQRYFPICLRFRFIWIQDGIYLLKFIRIILFPGAKTGAEQYSWGVPLQLLIALPMLKFVTSTSNSS
jgi:hypothetical protein